MDRLKRIINEAINDALFEIVARYRDTATPHHSKAIEPPVSNGSHSSWDRTPEVSPSDWNGERFVSSEHYCIPDKRFLFYKVKIFGNPDIKSTMDIFGNSTEALRKEIDRLNGAARRNGKHLIYRTITSESNAAQSDKSGNMINTFWEYSFNGGQNWYVMMPNGVDKMKESTFKI